MSRLPTGGRIDRTVTWHAILDGEPLAGHPGDTVASAMLAAGRIEVAPSIYRNRPRGILTSGVTEPNALLTVHGPGGEPMLPATTVPLTDGLSADLLSGVGALDPEPSRAGTTVPTGTPTCWWSGPDRPGWPPRWPRRPVAPG